MLRTWLRILPLLLLIGSGILLLEGLPILTEPFIRGMGLPFGTLVVWVGITMVPLSILTGIRLIRKPISLVYRFYHRAFWILTALSSLWGPVSYLLAGNWTYTFTRNEGFRGSNLAFSVFIYFTAITIALSLLMFIIFGIHHFILQHKKK